MANVKQLNMLSAKAKQADMEFDREATKALENGDVTALVDKFNAAIIAKGTIPYGLEGDELEAAKAAITKQPQQPEKKPQQQSEFSPVRLGMAEKLVLQEGSIKYLIANPTEFKKRVGDLYQLLSEAEEEVRTSFSSSSYDKQAPISDDDLDQRKEVNNYVDYVNTPMSKLVLRKTDTINADHNGLCRSGICDYCGGSFQKLRLLSNKSFVCGACAYKNANDNKSDGGCDEVTNPSYIEAEWKQRKGIA